MKEWTNSRLYNAIAWVSVVVMIGLTLTLVAISVKQATQSAEKRGPPSPISRLQRNARGKNPGTD